jgi:hypothetical protein
MTHYKHWSTSIISVFKILICTNRLRNLEQDRCQFCEKTKPQVKCRECAVTLCHNCSELIHSRGLFKLHVITSIEFASTNFTKKRQHRCAIHDQDMNVYCKQDLEVIWSHCVLAGAHKGHDCVSLASQCLEARNEISGTVTSVNQINTELMDSYMTLNNLIESVKKNANDRRVDLDRYEEELIKATKARFFELREKVTRTESDKVCLRHCRLR